MKRGEIYVVDLGPAVGHEAGGVRPVVVMSNDVSNEAPVLVAAVPAANSDEPRVGPAVPAARSGYPVDLVIQARQVRVLDAGRFPEGASGAVPADLMDRLTTSLKVFLDIP